MKKAGSLFLALMVVNLIFIFGGMREAEAKDEVFKWKMQTHHPVVVTQYKNIQWFCEKARIMSRGRLDITPFPAGALVPSSDIFSSVGRGVVEMGHSSVVYQSGIAPQGLSFFLPRAARSGDDLYAFWKGGVQEIYDKEYAAHNVKLLVIKQSDFMNWISRKPINRISDLRGLKIRTFGPLALLASELGASVVSLPLEEAYQALALGTIDAASYGGYSTFYKMKWYEVAKHLMEPPVAMATWGEDMYVNMDRWNNLPPDLQEILLILSEALAVKERYDLLSENNAALEAMKAEGLTVHVLPPDDVKVLDEAAERVWGQLAKRDARTYQVVKLMTDHLRERGYTQFKLD